MLAESLDLDAEITSLAAKKIAVTPSTFIIGSNNFGATAGWWKEGHLDRALRPEEHVHSSRVTHKRLIAIPRTTAVL